MVEGKPMIQIRPFEEKDFSSIVELDNNFAVDPLGDTELHHILFEEEIACEVLTFDTKVIGYIIYFSSEKTIEIINIFVHPHYRRDGLATELVRQILVVSDQEKLPVYSYISETNLETLHFYKNMGFRAVTANSGVFKNDLQKKLYTLKYLKSERAVHVDSNRIIHYRSDYEN